MQYPVVTVPWPGKLGRAVDITLQSWILCFSGRDSPQRMLMGKLGTAGLGTGLEDAANHRGCARMLQLLGLALISECKGKN